MNGRVRAVTSVIALVLIVSVLAIKLHHHRMTGVVTSSPLASTGSGQPAQQGKTNVAPQARDASDAPTTTVPTPGAKTEVPTWRSPAPGTYRYHYSRTSSQPADYDATVVVVSAPGDSYTETRDYKSVKVQRRYTIDAQGLAETGFVLQSASGAPSCRWSNPILVVPGSPSDGQTWTSVATCSMTVAGTASKIGISSTATVVGIRSAKVGNATVPLLRIDRKVELRTTANGQTGTRTSTVTDYFDTNRGLLAQSTEDARETGPSGTTTYRIVESMLTLQPEVSR